MTSGQSATLLSKGEPRRRASLACQNCRQRKVKCDVEGLQSGQKCTPCQRTNSRCLLNRDGDLRKSGSRKHIETLEQRIRSLETLLQQGGSKKRKLSDAAKEDSRSIRDISPIQEPTDVNDQTSMDDTDSPTSIVNDNAMAGPLPPSKGYISPQAISWLECETSFSPLIGGNLGNAETTSEDRFHHSEANSWPAKSPSDSDRGQGQESNSRRNSKGREEGSCALGPTSQPHILSPPGHDHMPTHDELSEVGIPMDINSVQLRSRLLQSFFRYQTLWVSMVDEKLFYTHREAGHPSFWYSDFLETVMLACAARLSTSSAVRSLAQKFASQASAGFLFAIEKPSAASLQGFLLLSEYEVTHGRDRMGWMLCGIATRMLVDIGLHEPMFPNEDTSSAQRPSPLLHLCCATISYEGIWCLYLGRPSAIPRSIVKVAALGCRACKGHEAVILTAWMELCVPMAEICEILNSSTTSLGPTTKSTLLELDSELRKWRDNLPAGMAYDDNSVPDLDPTAYGIHMQFCKVQILIHKAFLEDAAIHRSEKSSTSVGDTEDYGQIIYQNAIQIVRLLLTYRQMQGIEKIPSIMLDNVNLALMVLVTAFRKNPSQFTTNSRDVQWFRLTVNTMDALQPHFPVITRMLRTLQPMVDGTALSDMFSFKSPSPSSHPGGSPPVEPSFADLTHNFDSEIINIPTPQVGVGGGGRHVSNSQPSVEMDKNYVNDALIGQVSTPDRQWMQQDIGEFTLSLLSLPNLQLSSLWAPGGGSETSV